MALKTTQGKDLPLDGQSTVFKLFYISIGSLLIGYAFSSLFLPLDKDLSIVSSILGSFFILTPTLED